VANFTATSAPGWRGIVVAAGHSMFHTTSLRLAENVGGWVTPLHMVTQCAMPQIETASDVESERATKFRTHNGAMGSGETQRRISRKLPAVWSGVAITDIAGISGNLLLYVSHSNDLQGNARSRNKYILFHHRIIFVSKNRPHTSVRTGSGVHAVV